MLGNWFLNKKRQEFLARFIVESDAIAGILDDPDRVRYQIEIGQEAGHVGALLFLEEFARDARRITEEAICYVQGLITAEQHTKPGAHRLRPEQVGSYRSCDVFVAGRKCPSFSEVPELMDQWISSVLCWQKESTEHSPVAKVREIAQFHFGFERIHPFVDGNGRSGRALAYYLLRFGGIEPFIFTARDKVFTYYRCFDEPEMMLRYFEQRIPK